MEFRRVLFRSSALMFAARKNDVEKVRSLIAAGANIDLRDEFGMPALNQAVVFGNLETVLALIAAGANVNIIDIVGSTAFTLAALTYNVGIMRALLDAGLKPTDEDRVKWDEAVAKGLAKGAIHVRNQDGAAGRSG